MVFAFSDDFINFRTKTMAQNQQNFWKKHFSNQREMAHSAHSWPFARNSLRFIIYS
jgi:hypothetical protein